MESIPVYSIVTALVRFIIAVYLVLLLHAYTLPEVGEIENIETTVKFLSNGTPNFWMSFLVNLKFSKSF